MLKLFLSIIELVRVLLVLILGLMLLFFVESKLLMITLEGTPYALLMFGNMLLIFVFYRNKLQFSGWYKGNEVKKLTRRTTWFLVIVALVALVLAIFLNSYKAV